MEHPVILPPYSCWYVRKPLLLNWLENTALKSPEAIQILICPSPTPCIPFRKMLSSLRWGVVTSPTNIHVGGPPFIGCPWLLEGLEFLALAGCYKNIKNKDNQFCKACSTRDRNAYKVLIRTPKGKRPLRRPRLRWEDNIETDLK
jgi:hypothetical protein